MILFISIFFPLLELYLLIYVGTQIGALSTIALSILTAVFGALLIRWQGLPILMRMEYILFAGEIPTLELIESTVLSISGLMLLIPGFLTDILGFILLIPPIRRFLINWSIRYAIKKRDRIIDYKN